MTLAQCDLGKQYQVAQIATQDSELNEFLFTLGCYEGEQIVVVSRMGKNYVVAIKDGRYNLDQNLASAIVVAS